MSSRLNADLIAAILFVLIGCSFLAGTFDLPYGTWRKIGPGAFPALIATALIAMGILVAIAALRSGVRGPILRFDFAKLLVIIASIVVFGIVIRGGGLLPAVLCCCCIASLASRPFRPVAMALYGLFLGAACSLAFVVGLGMPVSIIGPWFGW